MISTIFWDIGGVLLTNGWDHLSRVKGAEAFGLEWEEFEARHQAQENAFDRGLMTLDEYLDRVIFYKDRKFSRQEISEYIFAQSQPHPEIIAIADELARGRKYFLATLNNEPLELNLRRIEKFGLKRHFSAFFSSCFLGLAKPDPAIYRRVLQITQRDPGECLFIDDRPANLTSAATLGIRTCHHNGNPADLRLRLTELLST